MPDRSAAIRIRGLRKAYASRIALDGLDLDVPAGSVYGFLGPNGAGKTTTMRILVGLIRPDAGQVELFGVPFDGSRRHVLHRVGALIEKPAFLPYLSGRDNLRVVGTMGPAVSDARVDELLDLMGLAERGRDPYDAYSQGMRQRLGIAAALLNDPPLLLLDEPANGLDPAGIADLRRLFRGLAASGRTILVSSHILPEIEQLADLVGIIDRGRLVRQGPLPELLGNTGKVRIAVRPDQAQAAVRTLGADGSPVAMDGTGPGWLTVAVEPDRAAELNRRLVAAGIDVTGLEAGSDLEDLFLSLTEHPS